MNESYSTKFRPNQLTEVIGQNHVVKSLKRILDENTVRCFVLHGPAGVGKTTTARIIASMLGCQPENRLDIDGATYTGIDKMREITESLRFRPLTQSKVRVVIVDEAHRLSKPAWDSLLKDTEEPADGVYWIFCTTEPFKIPSTIRSRGATYEFKPVNSELLFDFLVSIARKEQLEVSEDVIYAIAQQAYGSVRVALMALAQCSGCSTVDEVREILHVVNAEEGEAVELARLLVRGCTWSKAVKILAKLDSQNPESVRMVILAYLSRVLLNTQAEDSAEVLIYLLSCFSKPYNYGEGMAPLVLSVGKAIFI